jgi:hypothetical protein
MTNNNKAAGCGDTQAAQQNIFRLNFTQIVVRLKAACFRLVAWLAWWEVRYAECPFI